MSKKVNVYKNASVKTYDITDERREEYRRSSQEALNLKIASQKGLLEAIHSVNDPKIKPESLMPKLKDNKLRSLSLFSGGGGLDLGFDLAGYSHVASYELIPICGETLKLNRPNWDIYSGPKNGDVTKINWETYRNKVDIIHGGPPCQPFSTAGQQKGELDERNMWGEFSRAINTIKPKAFVAENVLGMKNPKFKNFIDENIYNQLESYKIKMFELNAADFGVPQLRKRVFFVGFNDEKTFDNFSIPEPTHYWKHLDKKNSSQNSLFELDLPKTLGVREALSLPDIGFDAFAPTLRSGFTGKRNTTSILNSTAGQKAWSDLEIWPNGVQANRESASNFPSKNGHFRLSVQDCALLQGFPSNWPFAGATYQILGQIGNSVAPPVAYNVAASVARALKLA